VTELNKLFAATKQAFDLPEGVIYLDGNSLGPMTHASRTRLIDEMDNQWSQKLIRGWNESGWYQLAQTVGDKIAALIGAPKGTVTAADNTSINVHKVLSAALAMNPGRKVILSDSGNFPTDLYAAQGVIAGLNDGYELKVVTPEQVFDAIDESVAVVMITQVDYCTGRLHDMASITERARANGVKTIWDLCHSAGAMAIQLDALQVDFAVGCGYKYFNGGPGAPAFLYVREEHINNIQPVLTGWMGHASPFSFEQQYTPMQGIGRMRVGTPSILGLASLDAALDVFCSVSMEQIRQRSVELSEVFMDEVAKCCPQLELASPTDAGLRGSQVSYRFPQGYAVVQALIDHGVVGDFRMPDIIRFGITPLYLNRADIVKAAQIIGDVMANQLWDCDKFKAKQAVT